MNIKKLNTKQIKALTKEQLIRRIRRSDKSKSLDELRGLKRDQLRTLVYTENRKLAAPPKQKSLKNKKPYVKGKEAKDKKINDSQKELRRLYQQYYRRNKQVGSTVWGKEAADLLKDLLRTAKTREERIAAYKYYLETEQSSFEAHFKHMERIMKAFAKIAGDEHGEKFRFYRRGKKIYYEEKQSDGQWHKRSFTGGSLYWKMISRLKQLYPSIPSEEVIAIFDANWREMGFEGIMQKLDQLYQQQQERASETYQNFTSQYRSD